MKSLDGSSQIIGAPRSTTLSRHKDILTKDRKVWREQLQMHCGEVVYDDKEETAGKHEERIRKFKTAGDTHFTEDGILAEMSIEFVVRAKAKLAKEKVSRDDQCAPSRGDL